MPATIEARPAPPADRQGFAFIADKERIVIAKPDILIVDGHGFSWQRLCELRQQQIAWKKCEGKQHALFELRTDYRPRAERTAAGRYREPSLLDRM